MRLLVVNANTSPFVTDKVLAQARASASPGTQVEAVTGHFGGRIIGTRTEQAIGEHSTLALVAAHADGCDAVVVAVSYDTGVKAARELLDVPVVGMTEAGLLTACLLGGRVGVVTFGRRVRPLYEELVAGLGLASRVAGWRTLDSTAAYQGGPHPELDDDLVAAATHLVEHEGAETVLLAGAVMAGVPRRLQGRVAVPLIDGLDCAVRQAELLAALRLPKARTGSYARPGPREVVGLDEALARCLARPAP